MHPTTHPALLQVLKLYEEIDSGRARSAAPLFTEDAVYEGPKGLAEGREAINDLLASREDNKERHTIHSLSNTEVRPLDDGDVIIRAVVMIYASVEGVWELERVTRVKHILKSADGEFRIAQRLRIPLEAPAGDGSD